MVISDFEQALQELTNEKRDVFIAYLQGYSYQEIADRFQIPIGTVRSRISAARHQLDDRLSR
jgi:RNA polymerase ECF-type sigma factor